MFFKHFFCSNVNFFFSYGDMYHTFPFEDLVITSSENFAPCTHQFFLTKQRCFQANDSYLFGVECLFEKLMKPIDL